MSTQTKTSRSAGTRSATRAAAFGPFALFDTSTVLSGPAASAFAQVGELFGERCLEWQRELAAFVSARMQADGKLPAELGACRSPTDIARVQQAWLEAAAAAYLEESERLGEIATTAVQDGMASWLAAFEMPAAAEEQSKAA